ncbi:hypothetical protein Uis1B_1404 [Bifidobacterium margollesii]|uniref:DUF3592 domain-containing protein n=1 Tax=Bifidobacterium margollesii TaxID=2020964 RepID=A0A2N5J9D6_9BIFI|nr:DUF3592 domain-containing protein [Bifidobacterium margollesii]PLS30822.1 hypothetical protein Uis1B_1404 [Bifidobacterium margollesii]
MASDIHGTPESPYGIESSYGTDQRPIRNIGNNRGFWSRWSWAVFCGLFTIVGAALLVPSAGALISEINLLRDCTEITDGTVTQLIFNPADPSDDDSSDSWTPVFRYGASGKIYEQRYSVASSPPQYEEGEAVTIRYDPADPNRYVVEGNYSPLILYGVITIMCLAFASVLPVAIVIAVRSR